MKVQAVLFDMDGILLDTEVLGKELFIKYTEEQGYDYIEGSYEHLLGTNSTATVRLGKEDYGNDFPIQSILSKMHEEYKQLAKQGKLPVKEGSVKCLQGLKERNIKIALVTSTARNTVNGYVTHLPEIYNQMDVIVCGDEIEKSKPHPDIYQKAMELLGVPSEKCLGVEDSLNGLKSLTAANVESVMVPDILHYGEKFAPYTKHCISSLNELCHLVDALMLLPD